MNIAPKTAVFLAIFTTTCTVALAIANAERFKPVSWLAIPLAVVAVFFLALAIKTAFFPTRNEKFEQDVQAMMRSIRKLRSDHKNAGSKGSPTIEVKQDWS